MKNPEGNLAMLLRAIGTLDMLALIAVITPTSLHAGVHQALGLGKLPLGPLTDYLTRSASSLYAMHGAILFYLAMDIRRYRRLIRFLALIRIAHGITLLGIDIAAGMPGWWMMAEGLLYFAPSVAILWIADQIRPDKPLPLS